MTPASAEPMGGKPVRDRIPERLQAAGVRPTPRPLGPDEYVAAPTRAEEAAEFAADGRLEELADVVEVVHAVLAARGLDWAALDETRLVKRATWGGFERRLLLLETGEASEPSGHPSPSGLPARP